MPQEVAYADSFSKDHLNQLVQKAMSEGVMNGLNKLGFSDKQMSGPVLIAFLSGVQELFENVGIAMYNQGLLTGSMAEKTGVDTQDMVAANRRENLQIHGGGK